MPTPNWRRCAIAHFPQQFSLPAWLGGNNLAKLPQLIVISCRCGTCPPPGVRSVNYLAFIERSICRKSNKTYYK